LHVTAGELTYEWLEDWAAFPDSPSARAGWAHHGVIVAASGDVIACHQGEATILVFSADGSLTRSIPTDLLEVHSMTFARFGDQMNLWVADPGAKRSPDMKYEYPPGARKGQAAKLDDDGNIVQSILAPGLPIYDGGVYSPTAVAVFDDPLGGNGDVWVADGYGQSYLHRYDKDSNLIASFNGEESDAGRFDTPHGLMIDTRKSDPELYVADRANNRIVVLDMEGQFKRVINSGALSTPCAFATDGEILAVAELRARVSLLDSEDRLIGYIGANEVVCDRPGWPNAFDEDGTPVRPPEEALPPGKLNSPHGIAMDGTGSIYVPEWLIGGRFIKLQKG